MNTSFSTTTCWQSHDIFLASKTSTFRSSLPAVLELAQRYPTITADADVSSEEFSILFREVFEICLWGNATDLSLLTTLSYSDIQSLQGSKARKESEKNIIANNLDEVYKLLSKLKKDGVKERRVDIVLDNAGFELFVDLVLAGFLLSTGLATNVVLHPKSIPWFVSDVLPSDFGCLLNALADPQTFFVLAEDAKKLAEDEMKSLKGLFESWAGMHAEGQLTIRPNRVWTAAGSFWRLKVEKHLWADLAESELVIFKGDLNYRKLTGDVCSFSLC